MFAALPLARSSATRHSPRRWLRDGLLVIAVALVLGGIRGGLELQKRPTLSIELESDQLDVVQIFFDQGAGWQDSVGERTQIGPGRQVLTFRLPRRLAEIQRLRVDPSSYAGCVRLRSIALQRGDFFREWTAPGGFSGWSLPEEPVRTRLIDGTLEIQHSAQDPQVVLQVPPVQLFPPVRQTALKAAGTSAGGALIVGLLLLPWFNHLGRLGRLAFASSQWTFLAVGSAAGLVFVFATPPFQVPDEPLHFYRAYHISEGHLLPDRVDGKGAGELPASLERAWEAAGSLTFRSERKWTARLRDETWAVELNPSERKTLFFPNVAVYSPVPYAGTAAAITCGRLCGVRPIVLLYAARLANLALSLGLVWLAIRLTPLGGRVLCVLGLMPETLQLFGSMSADAPTIGLGFLTFAILLRAAFGAEQSVMKPARVGGLMALNVLLVLTKTIYMTMPLMLWLVPAQRWGGPGKKLASVACALALSLGVASAWSSIGTRYWPDPWEISGTHTSRSEQMAHIKAKPWRLVTACLKTSQMHYARWRVEMVGCFGWLDAALPQPVVDGFLALLLLVSVSAGVPGIKIGGGDKCVAALTGLSMAGLTALALYLFWTPVGGGIIEGLQGRYLIPIMPLFCLLVYNTRVRVRVSTARLNTASAAWSTVILGLAFVVLHSRFYG